MLCPAEEPRKRATPGGARDRDVRMAWRDVIIPLFRSFSRIFKIFQYAELVQENGSPSFIRGVSAKDFQDPSFF